MAKRGGFPGMGMPGNMNNLMKQAQKMQRQMEENQKALEEKEFTAAAGGGAVEVIIFNGHGQAVLWQGAAAQRRIYDTNYTVEASGGAHSGTAEEENCKDT